MSLTQMGEDDWNEILTDPRKTTLLAGDGSNRTYKRVRLEESNQSYIIMELQGKDKNLLEQDKYSWPIIAKTLAQKRNANSPMFSSGISYFRTE